ncbi:helix-turn-helix transcriptional regulator [Streptomyces montanisoli]|uniref:WYL domain-containing protein n=1 Tax=Streptomyces montanisoli TaxID=2798581 RepID=A0A940MCM6_9ACTN|nr:WYL domain-containing protein [Streptomyces montanisoli]MBP0460530.1 WYL domain-containing protein [Streptomyces montanisoli]
MRAARLIKMVLLLQSRPLMTAAQLARELEVSERTITRDAQALSEAGVPVYADRGRSGGYRLVGGYRTGLTGLARGEAEALFLSGLPGALREMGLADAASAARLKVSAALMPSLRDTPDSVARRFHLDAPGWYREPQTPELLPVLAEAVWADRLISAVYARGSDGAAPAAPVARELAPYGLVLKAGVWYACAEVTDSEGDARFRVYRIDRFVSAAVLEERFRRDPDFELEPFWEERSAEFARSLLRYEVTLRLTKAGAARLPHVTDRAAAEEALASAPAPDAEGRVTVTLAMESEDVAYGQLLGLAAEAEVLAPAALRARFAEAARAMTRLYG